MAGSLAEWTLDNFAAGVGYSFPTGAQDPIGDPTSSSRAIRGGSYLTTLANPKDLRAAARTGASATTPDVQIGFRCVKR
jgi:formylglycine-generating enzyme required for sulfatase activity